MLTHKLKERNKILKPLYFITFSLSFIHFQRGGGLTQKKITKRARLNASMQQRLSSAQQESFQIKTYKMRETQIRAVFVSGNNEYTSIWCCLPSCSCPDFTKSNNQKLKTQCKHLYHLMVSRLSISLDSALLCQVAYTPQEINHFFGILFFNF